MIHTVLGPVDCTDIHGAVLAHEHLVVDLRTDMDKAGFLGAEHAASAVAELEGARQRHGLSLMVELSCRGMGRDVSALQGIAEHSGVAVVAATGWYYERFHPEGEPGLDVDQATEWLLGDLLHGIDGTEVLAGVIGEVGTHGLEPTTAERISLLAAGQAAKISGRSIATHAHLGTGAMAQLGVLDATGVPLNRVCIGHQDLTEETSQHVAIAEAGAFVAFDTVGKMSYQPDEVRLRMILELLDRGLGRHLVLSNDISRYAYLRSNGGHGYCHVLSQFALNLRHAGVDETTLRDLYRDNALRWLTGSSDVAVGDVRGLGVGL